MEELDGNIRNGARFCNTHTRAHTPDAAASRDSQSCLRGFGLISPGVNGGKLCRQHPIIPTRL